MRRHNAIRNEAFCCDEVKRVNGAKTSSPRKRGSKIMFTAWTVSRNGPVDYFNYRNGIPAFAGMTSAYAGMTMWAMCVVLSVGVHPLRAERAGDQGYGVMVGNPSGLSAKYWLDEKAAIDGALGVARGEFDIHLTLLYHIFNWLPEGESRKDAFHRHVQNKELPLYVGIGPRLLFEHEEELGIRFPIGMSFLPQKSPWEIFFEVAPVLRLTPNGGFNGDFAVGVRYYIPAIRPKEMK